MKRVLLIMLFLGAVATLACKRTKPTKEVEEEVKGLLTARMQEWREKTPEDPLLNVTSVQLVRESDARLEGFIIFDNDNKIPVTVLTEGEKLIWKLTSPEDLNRLMERRREEDRDKALHAMGDMRSIGTVMEAYAIDHKRYPIASSTKELSTLVVPEYYRVELPTDPWGTPYRVEVTADGTSYRLTSAGSDRQFQPMPKLEAAPAGGGEIPYYGPRGGFDDPKHDIVFENGQFNSWFQR